MLVQVSQKFFDNTEYTKQIDFIFDAVNYFGISRMYIDNTRDEFTDRDLPRQCIPIKLSSHDGPRAMSKMKLATNYAKMVEQRRLRLLDDDRFLSQLTMVNNKLEAPSTPMGHADSFISVILAIGVYFDFFAQDRKLGFAYLGNMQEVVQGQNAAVPNKIVQTTSAGVCKVCGSRIFEATLEGKQKCVRCYTTW